MNNSNKMNLFSPSATSNCKASSVDNIPKNKRKLEDEDHYEFVIQNSPIKKKRKVNNIWSKIANQRAFECDKCDFHGKDERSLQRHMLSHDSMTFCRSFTWIKIFQCATCCKQFGQRSDLNHHMLLHTRENICDGGFSRKSTLQTHMLIHKDGKRFECKVCDFRTKYKSSLKGHLKSKRHLKKSGLAQLPT